MILGFCGLFGIRRLHLTLVFAIRCLFFRTLLFSILFLCALLFGTLLLRTFFFRALLFFLVLLLRIVLLLFLFSLAARGAGCRIQDEGWRWHKPHHRTRGDLHSLSRHGDQRVYCTAQVDRGHDMTAFDGVIERYPVFRRKVEHVAGTPNPDGCGRRLHLELVFVEACDRPGKRAHRSFQQGDHAIARCIRRSVKLEFVDAHLGICTNGNECPVVHSQLSHSIRTGNDQFACLDFAATNHLACSRSTRHADVARNKIELASARQAFCHWQRNQQEAQCKSIKPFHNKLLMLRDI
ncbi:MAG: hypothetical protein WC073_00905 [Sterolibacterium sp.]